MFDKNAFRAELARRGLTQKEVAHMIGMSEKTFVSRIKHGNFGLDECDLIIKAINLKDPASIFFAEQDNCG